MHCSTLASDRQKLSFGLWTNVTGGALFSVAASLGTGPATVRFSSTADGRLLVDMADVLRLTTDEELADGKWHKVSVMHHNQKVSVSVDGDHDHETHVMGEAKEEVAAKIAFLDSDLTFCKYFIGSQ